MAANPSTFNLGGSVTGTNFNPVTDYTVPDLVNAGIVLGITVAGIGSFLFLLWGGVQWVMAGGEKEALEKAKKIITNSLIGLVLTLSSYALFYVVTYLFFGDATSVFTIPKI